jgi:hypothetical protein
VLGLMGAMVLVVHAVEFAEKRGKRRAVVFSLIALVVWALIDYFFILPELRDMEEEIEQERHEYQLYWGGATFQTAEPRNLYYAPPAVPLLSGPPDHVLSRGPP